MSTDTVKRTHLEDLTSQINFDFNRGRYEGTYEDIGLSLVTSIRSSRRTFVIYDDDERLGVALCELIADFRLDEGEVPDGDLPKLVFTGTIVTTSDRYSPYNSVGDTLIGVLFPDSDKSALTLNKGPRE